jgi:large subunit ribosomal protein L4
MELDVFNMDGQKVRTVELPAAIFEAPINIDLMHQAYVRQMANARLGTHSTKTRGEVSGGGRKPWKQKGTGRARSGSIRSPLWRGGGTIFGPLPRDYSYKLPKKVKKIALATAFQEKLSSGEIVIIDSLSLQKPKTKDMITILKNLGIQNRSVLIVLPEKNDTVTLSARNIPGVYVKRAADLNTYDVVSYNTLLLTKDAAARLEEIKRP